MGDLLEDSVCMREHDWMGLSGSSGELKQVPGSFCFMNECPKYSEWQAGPSTDSCELELNV